MKIELQDGKYQYLLDETTGKQEVLRHGEEWRDTTGDGFILAMAQRIEELEKELSNKRCEVLQEVLSKKLSIVHGGREVWIRVEDIKEML